MYQHVYMYIKRLEVSHSAAEPSACDELRGHAVLFLSPYLEGQGDFVRRLIVRITRVTIWVMGVINLLTQSP